MTFHSTARRALCAGLALATPVVPAATSPVRITAVVNSYPSAAPDGLRLVFQSNRTGRFRIYTMNTSGAQIQELTHGPDDQGGASFSPDGRQILFASWRDDAHGGGSDVYLMDADGTHTRRLTNDGTDNSHPHWSADGSRIIFNSSRTTPITERNDPAKERDDIFSMKPDGSDLQQLTHCNAICTYAHYSPDMKRMVYRKVTNTPGLNWDLSEAKRNSEIFVANADGTNEVNISNNAAFDGWPAWAPDGDLIAFASNRGGPENHGQIYTIKPDGSGLRQISTPPNSYVQPSWSADSAKIYAYTNTEVGEMEWGDVVMFELSKN